MQHWKFLLYGITGDLAKKKILPALAQFAYFNQDTVTVELIGYSRSDPDPIEIGSILRANTPNRNHAIQSITFLKGEYLSPETYFDIIGKLKEDERLITYLAIPPYTFLKILQNSCPYSHRPIDIIMEKPFGENPEQAQNILDVVRVCDLGSHVHFCDHYLFKTAAQPNYHDTQNFTGIQSEPLKKITVTISESVDVAGRGGYYNSIGALKDMFIHTYSLTKIGLSICGSHRQVNYDSFVVKNVEMRQYKGYLSDVGVDESRTDTYFKINGEIMVDGNPVMIELTSGKKLPEKLTQIELFFIPGNVLKWELAPQQRLSLVQNDNITEINLDRSSNLDHTNLFEDMLRGSEQHFVPPSDIIQSWQIYEKITTFIEENNISLGEY
jgi:glucose-6-phosphate 1-dehydrogenase